MPTRPGARLEACVGAFAGVVLALLVAGSTGCSHRAPHGASSGAEDRTIQELVGSERGPGSLHTLSLALSDAGLSALLGEAGPFTVFAPTEEAFAKVSTEQLLGLLASPDIFRAVLMQHVVVGHVEADQLGTLDHATTLRGGSLPIEHGQALRVGGARVLETDLRARNGVIHTIDRVLLPPALIAPE